MIEFAFMILMLLGGFSLVSVDVNPLHEHAPDASVGVGRDKLCPDGWDRIRTYKGIGNQHNYVAVLRSAWCQRAPLDHLPTYFVFIHKRGERESLNNLAFWYDTTDFTVSRLARLAWRDANAITITVPLDTISGIGRQRSLVNGVSITYDFPGTFAPGETPRPSPGRSSTTSGGLITVSYWARPKVLAARQESDSGSRAAA